MTPVDPEALRNLTARHGQRATDAVVGILTVCHTLAEFAALGEEDFVQDVRTRWAAEMGLIRIGEYVNRLPLELLAAHPEQPWRLIIGMRNFAARQYDDLDPHRVWRTLTRDITSLADYLIRSVIGSA